MIKQSIAQLLETEMDRKDFLKTLAIAAVAVTGVTSLVNTLTNQAITRSLGGSAQQPTRGLGYGVSRYSTPQTPTFPAKSAYSS